MDGQKKCNKKAVIKFAGAFIAWVIGAGFSTGQEILQFFTSYGYLSYGVVLLNLIGFLFLGKVLLVTGYEHKTETPFNHFKYFCGKKLGAFYSWLVPVTLILIMPVLISGAGATLSEYYGINHYIGSAIMAGMVLCAYLIGFERLVKIVSTIGPVIIIFSLLVGATTVIHDFNNFTEVTKYESILSESQSAPHWIISSILYLPLSFLGGSAYFIELGKSADNQKDAKYGAFFGAIAVILAIAIMNTAILLNAENIASLEIPTLYLAKKISNTLGAVFSIVLILGMFSSCSAMMWSVCNRFTIGGKRGNKVFAIMVAICTYVLGLFPFSELVGILYPLVGYVGLIFIGCVINTGIKDGGRTMSYENVKKYFEDAGLGERVKVFEQSSATVEMAAEAVGCDIKQIAKTLSFLVDDSPILVVAAGNVKIDNKKYKDTFHQKSKMIPGELVEEYIGHGLGGVCPFAVNPNVAIYLDVSLKQNDVVYPGSGNENSIVELSMEELERHSAFRDWVDVCKAV